MNLASRDLRAARAIAREVRESSGGLPAVRAMGVDLPELGAVQVSMNLTDFTRTSMLDAFRAVATGGRAGVAVTGLEIIGLVPAPCCQRTPNRHLLLAALRLRRCWRRGSPAARASAANAVSLPAGGWSSDHRVIVGQLVKPRPMITKSACADCSCRCSPRRRALQTAGRDSSRRRIGRASFAAFAQHSCLPSP